MGEGYVRKGYKTKFKGESKIQRTLKTCSKKHQTGNFLLVGNSPQTRKQFFGFVKRPTSIMEKLKTNRSHQEKESSRTFGHEGQREKKEESRGRFFTTVGGHGKFFGPSNHVKPPTTPVSQKRPPRESKSLVRLLGKKNKGDPVLS